MIETLVLGVLSADTGVQAIVGSRIYAMLRPQADPLPALVYQRVSTVPVVSLQGDSSLDQVRLQVSCYASTLLQAKQLAAATRRAINGASGLKSITVMEIDDQDPETKHFRVVVDFNIWQRG